MKNAFWRIRNQKFQTLLKKTHTKQHNSTPTLTLNHRQYTSQRHPKAMSNIYQKPTAHQLQFRSPSLPNINKRFTENKGLVHGGKRNVFSTSDRGVQLNHTGPTIDTDTGPEFDFNNAGLFDNESPIEPSNSLSPKNNLTIPKSFSNQISVTSSIDHSNLSVIDMYGDNNSFISTTEPIEGDAAIGSSFSVASSSNNINRNDNNNNNNNNDDNNNNNNNNTPSTDKNLDKENSTTTATANDLETIQSSRKSASKIRLSIEESQTKIASDRDRYGFKKKTNFVSSEEYNNWWADYSKHCARRKKKWEILMNKSGLSLNNDNPTRFPAKSEKLKRYIRKGIPAEWRGNAWWYFAKGQEKLSANIGLYDNLVESTVNLHNKDTEIIERDLNRTFPDNIHFRPDRADSSLSSSTVTPETPLIQALRRVLVAFSTYQPAIGYCQSLNFIVGLLLIFMDEEKAFWMLVIITSKFLPGVHEINLEGVNIDQGVLMLAIKEYLPDTWQKIISINFDDSIDPNENHDFLVKLPPVTLCTSSWFMSAFIGILPIETTLRVWDCFFYEESSFFFKTSLSIFKSLEPRLLAHHDEMEIFQIIQNAPKSIIDPSVLFDLIFKKRYGFNNLTQDDINRCRKFVGERRKRFKDIDKDAKFNRGLLDETLWQPDAYGFKKGLPGVHWNKNLTKKMRNIRKKP